MSLTSLTHQSQCVTFRLGNSLLGINILDIREIISFSKITPVAQSPDFVSGLMNLRGQILTILDVGVLLDFERPPAKAGSHIIIFKHHDVGFLVDQIGDVVGMDARRIEALPANIEPGIHDYMESVINMPDKILMLLSAKKVLSGTMQKIREMKEVI